MDKNIKLAVCGLGLSILLLLGVVYNTCFTTSPIAEKQIKENVKHFFQAQSQWNVDMASKYTSGEYNSFVMKQKPLVEEYRAKNSLPVITLESIDISADIATLNTKDNQQTIVAKVATKTIEEFKGNAKPCESAFKVTLERQVEKKPSFVVGIAQIMSKVINKPASIYDAQTTWKIVELGN